MLVLDIDRTAGDSDRRAILIEIRSGYTCVRVWRFLLRERRNQEHDQRGEHIGVTGNAAERGAILVERRCYDVACDSAEQGLDGLAGGSSNRL
jgi:hypothetical protein